MYVCVLCALCWYCSLCFPVCSSPWSLVFLILCPRLSPQRAQQWRADARAATAARGEARRTEESRNGTRGQKTPEQTRPPTHQSERTAGGNTNRGKGRQTATTRNRNGGKGLTYSFPKEVRQGGGDDTAARKLIPCLNSISSPRLLTVVTKCEVVALLCTSVIGSAIATSFDAVCGEESKVEPKRYWRWACALILSE